MAKKRFGIDQSTSAAISQTMQMAKHHDSNFINTEILISNIEIDADNPRKHQITISDLNNGIKKTDEDFEAKQKEYDGLLELSSSIQKEGLLHPVIVYKNGDKYKLVAGERRFFASILAQRSQIEARVFKEKPKALDLRLIQWMENDARKDLSLHKKLMNIESIIKAFKIENVEIINAQGLSKILCVSRTLCHQYLSILNNSPLMKLILEGNINHFRVARELTNYKSENDILEKLKELDEAKIKTKKMTPKITSSASKKSGPKRKRVNFGNTQNSFIVKELVNSVMSISKYKKYNSEFKAVDWTSFDDTTLAFQKLVKILEKHTREK